MYVNFHPIPYCFSFVNGNTFEIDLFQSRSWGLQNIQLVLQPQLSSQKLNILIFSCSTAYLILLIFSCSTAYLILLKDSKFPADAGFLCYTVTVLRDTIRWALCRTRTKIKSAINLERNFPVYKNFKLHNFLKWLKYNYESRHTCFGGFWYLTQFWIILGLLHLSHVWSLVESMLKEVWSIVETGKFWMSY
jgi:hypothetical protein